MAANQEFTIYKFELACYIDGVKGIHPTQHSFDHDTGTWVFVFPISQAEAATYESEFLGSESKKYDNSAWYFKKAKGPRRRGAR